MFRIRNLFHFDGDELSGAGGFEPPADTGGAEAGDGIAESSEPALLAGDTAEPSPAWAPSPDEWEHTQAELAELRAFVQQFEPDPGVPQPIEAPTLDPFADDFGSQLDQMLESKLERFLGVIDQRLQPVVETYTEQRVGEAEAKAKDILADIASREGEFDMGAARQLAESFLPEARQRYGAGPRAAEAALQKAAKTLREIEQRAEQRGAEKYRNQLANVSGASREPAAGGTAIRTIPDAVDEVDLARRLTGASYR